MPQAWQYPETTSARITIGDIEVRTEGFRTSEWMQQSQFVTRNGVRGLIEVYYNDERPAAAEGPFLAEERELINSLAEMLRMYLQHRQAREEIRRAHDDLERQVQARTAELRTMNLALQDQVAEYRKAQQEIEAYQRQLRRLAADLSLTEARERRAIASDLHDHIGQTLAIIRMKIAGFRNIKESSARDAQSMEILELLDQTIQYTRSLTFAISPPVLYELGLNASLEWLGEQFTNKHNLPVVVQTANDGPRMRDEVEVVVFKAVQELLTNALKHAEATMVEVRAVHTGDELMVYVIDDGHGFDTERLAQSDADGGFGLFSIRERLMHLGGSVVIKSSRDGTEVCLTVKAL
jgi:signal transduction histidine kinase